MACNSKAAFGLTLTRSERRAFASVAAEEAAAAESQGVLVIVGRRGGKTRMAAALAVYLGVLLTTLPG